ncbi:EamA family transporter [Bradyrhizobium sp. sBnM-33]|uniref:EamA family transporter n=1 Tax=Bradyrhizobium sp. sBnM-33 TaxID=2831780 RepID=UPI0028964646|nr:EamA family transporter [Bradyrhizobium sp. sBnM-33]WOH49303.1 EamA family transporter [Bradyrhizobium sp. sBnM-33]
MLLGFSAYVFLLHASTPERTATYAYVNPVVALVLGWAVLGEPVTATMLVAALIILTAVAGTITEEAGTTPPNSRRGTT